MVVLLLRRWGGRPGAGAPQGRDCSRLVRSLPLLLVVQWLRWLLRSLRLARLLGAPLGAHAKLGLVEDPGVATGVGLPNECGLPLALPSLWRCPPPASALPS